MTALIVGLCGCGFIGAVAWVHGDRLSLAVCAASAGAAVTGLWLGVPL